MSVEERVGQLFMVWARVRFMNQDSPEIRQLSDQITRYHVGAFAMSVPVEGMFLHKSEPYEAAMLLNQLQHQSKLPLLIAADFESGLSSRLTGATVLPQPMAFGAAGKLEFAETFGEITAQEARAIGVHWNFFPIADVNSNPVNPIINTRSFGENPERVGALVAAYIRGARSHGMLTTAKHFPGHGDTATDSHLGVAQVPGDLARLDSVEFPPFRKAIDAGVDAVMVAHVTVPALEPDPNRVATTSSAIVTQLLQQKLGFRGLVVTDALDMGGLTHLYAANIGRAAVEAFKAGNDLLLIPADLDASFRAIVDAVNTGEISRERLDRSVRKILEAKAVLGLQRARMVDIDAIGKIVGAPASQTAAQRISDEAIALVRANTQVLPLTAEGNSSTSPLPYQGNQEIHNRLVAVVFSDDVRLELGRTLERQLRFRVPDAHIFYVDPRIASAASDEILRATRDAEEVLAAVYAVPVPGARTGIETSSTDPFGTLLQKIIDQAAQKTIVVAVGNPYLAKDFPAIQNYLCTFSTASVSEISAVKALFAEIPVEGHLPVTIPGFAQQGEGIVRPAKP